MVFHMFIGVNYSGDGGDAGGSGGGVVVVAQAEEGEL